MKTLYVLNNFSIGGAETGLLHLIRHGFFKDAELEVVVLFNGSGKLKELLPEAGFTGNATALMPQENMTIPLLLQAYKKLKSHMKSSQPDRVILSLPQANILGRKAAKSACRKAKIITFEHNAHHRKGYYKALLKLTSGAVDAVLYDCEVTAKAMRKHYTNKSLPWHYVPLVCIPPMQQPKTDYALKTEYPAILSVGRLHEQKNYLEAIKAMQLLSQKGVRFHYYIAGEGEQRAELEAYIQKLGMESRITLLGFIDWTEWRMRADIFLQASQWEGLCISVLEAMGAAMPVVSTNVGGIQDYGLDKLNMMKAKHPEAQFIADAIEPLIDNETLRMRLGTHARADILARFSQESVEHQLQEVAAALNKL